MVALALLTESLCHSSLDGNFTSVTFRELFNLVLDELILHAEQDHAFNFIKLLGHVSILLFVIESDEGHQFNKDLVKLQIELKPSSLDSLSQLL